MIHEIAQEIMPVVTFDVRDHDEGVTNDLRASTISPLLAASAFSAFTRGISSSLTCIEHEKLLGIKKTGSARVQ